jgi:hypothetical protein
MYTSKILYTQEFANGCRFERVVNLDTECLLDDESALVILQWMIPNVLLATVIQTLNKNEETKYAA